MNTIRKHYPAQPSEGTPSVTPDDLERIRTFTRKDVTADEIYTFPLVLCDNEVDRDLEMFDTEALPALAEMFVGKTGIFDHSMSGRDQTARIYKTECVTDETRTTQTGDVFRCIRAYAYMPRIEKNADLIAEIDSGIKKEVSVACAVDVHRCSVCGQNVLRAPCAHRKGEVYDGKVCCHILEQPTDAYEWSFVAVPAQRGAGVTKSYTTTKGNMTMQEILKNPVASAEAYAKASAI